MSPTILRATVTLKFQLRQGSEINKSCYIDSQALGTTPIDLLWLADLSKVQTTFQAMATDDFYFSC